MRGSKNATGTQKIQGDACLAITSSLVHQLNWKTEAPAGEIRRGMDSGVTGSAGERRKEPPGRLGIGKEV